MPNPQQTGHARRQAQQQVGAVTGKRLLGGTRPSGAIASQPGGSPCPSSVCSAGNLQKAAEADLARYNAQKGAQPASLCLSPLLPLASAGRRAHPPRFPDFGLPAAVLEATLTNLRSKLSDLESDK